MFPSGDDPNSGSSSRCACSNEYSIIRVLRVGRVWETVTTCRNRVRGIPPPPQILSPISWLWSQQRPTQEHRSPGETSCTIARRNCIWCFSAGAWLTFSMMRPELLARPGCSGIIRQYDEVRGALNSQCHQVLAFRSITCLSWNCYGEDRRWPIAGSERRSKWQWRKLIFINET